MKTFFITIGMFVVVMISIVALVYNFGIFLLCIGILTAIITILIFNNAASKEIDIEQAVSDEERTEIYQRIEKRKARKKRGLVIATALIIVGFFISIIMMNSAPTKYTKELSNLENYIEQESIGDALYSINEFEKKRDDMTDKEVKKLDELIPKMKAMSENKAKDKIQTAETKIRNKDYVAASNILEEIISNEYVTEQTRKEAEEMLSPIAEQIVEQSNGEHLGIKSSDFIEKYNKAFEELYPEDMFGNSLLKTDRLTVATPGEVDDFIGASTVYKFDQTHYSSANTKLNATLLIYVDEFDNCLCISVIRSMDSLPTDIAKEHYLDKICFAAYIAATDDTNYDNFIKPYKEMKIARKNGCEYVFTGDNEWIQFVISAGTRLSNWVNS